MALSDRVIMKKAIVVEDNLLLAVIYRQYLKRMGIDITAEVTSGEKAIEILKKEKVDLIIMDIMLEGKIDGIEAMVKVREFSKTPVIFASSNSDEFHFSKAKLISNSIFLVKPVTEKDFNEAVSQSEDLRE